MKPLATTQLMLTWYGLLQNKNSTTWQKFAYALFSLFNFIVIVIQCASSAIFVMHFLIIDLELALFGVSQICAFSPILYLSLVTLLLRRRTTAIIEEVTMIFNSSMYSFYVLINKSFPQRVIVLYTVLILHTNNF